MAVVMEIVGKDGLCHVSDVYVCVCIMYMLPWGCGNQDNFYQSVPSLSHVTPGSNLVIQFFLSDTPSRMKPLLQWGGTDRSCVTFSSSRHI